MRNFWKKVTAYILCVVLGVSAWAGRGIPVNAKQKVGTGAIPQGLALVSDSESLPKLTSGVCGEHITWTYDETSKTMEFAGTGAIYDTEGALGSKGLLGSWSVWQNETEHLVIGEGITEIGYGNFLGFSDLESISFPDTLTEIGDFSFCDLAAYSHISIVFPPNLKKIGDYAFMAGVAVSSGQMDVTLPNGLERLGYYAFSRQNIKEIVIPGSIHYINEGVFVDCDKLRKVTLENGVEMISYQMCMGCTNLKTVEIPNTVKEIGEGAFDGCKKLKSIKIPDGVQRIFDYAFFGSGITQITLPDTVTTLGNYVFEDCSKLKKVKLPAHLADINTNLFRNCKKLKAVKLPQTVTYVDMSAFWGTGITKLVLPSNITMLATFPADLDDPKIFPPNKVEMPKLKQLVIQSSKLKAVSDGAFYGIKKTCVIKVPKKKFKKYKKMIYQSGVDKKVKIKAAATGK